MTSKSKAHKTKDCVMLIRVSTLDQATADKGGIDAQRDSCKKIAEHHDLNLRWVIQLEGVSGAAVKRSPKFHDLLRIVKSGECAGVVLKEESRLMRPESFGDYEVFETLQEYNVSLYLLDRVVDFSTYEGRFMATLMAAVAGRERAIIRERTLGGKRAKRSRGEVVGGKNSVPIGLRIEELPNKVRRYAVDPETIGRVKLLFQMVVDGETSWKTLAAATGIGYYSVRKVLQNPIYTGTRVIREMADPKLNAYRDDGTLRYQMKRVLPEEEQEHIRVLENAPISKDVFERVQQMIAVKREFRSVVKNAENDPFIYRGFLRCSVCGSTLYCVPYTDRRRSGTLRLNYYMCRSVQVRHGGWSKEAGDFEPKSWAPCGTTRVRVEKMHPLLDELVQTQLGSFEFFLKATEAAAATEQDESHEEQILADIEHKKKSISRLLDLHVDGKVDVETFDRKRTELRGEIEALNRALRASQVEKPTVSVAMQEQLAREFARWDKMDLRQKRLALTVLNPVFKVTAIKLPGKSNVRITVDEMQLNFGGFGTQRALTLDLKVV